ncbi:hypothetical protein LEMLEM_LOCUS1108 [Lemmus lemmus]
MSSYSLNRSLPSLPFKCYFSLIKL